MQWPERGLQRQKQNVRHRSTALSNTHLPAAALCKASASVWGADEQWREIFGREKSDRDVPPVKELYRPPQPEPHFKSTRTQLVSEVEDLNKQVTSPSRDKEHWEKMTKQNTTDLTEAIVQLKSRKARIKDLGEELSTLKGCSRRSPHEAIRSSSDGSPEERGGHRLERGAAPQGCRD